LGLRLARTVSAAFKVEDKSLDVHVLPLDDRPQGKASFLCKNRVLRRAERKLGETVGAAWPRSGPEWI